jgi:glycine cleavage system H lipoate-binding protein
MEGFHYVDIFATKHIEYLLVIGFLMLFIPFWRFLNRPVKAILETAERYIPSMDEWFRLPEKVYYHLGHSWALPEGSNVVRVGIDDFAQKLVGKIDEIKVPNLGSTIYQGDRGWALKVDSKVIEMLSPVDGKVIAINNEVINSPENINRDPYDNWLIKVESPRFQLNKRNLLKGALAKKWMEGVRENLLSRMNYNLGMVYQDGGRIVDGMAKNLDKEKWDEIVKDFFLVAES